jgi:hypothetical protein
MTGATLTFKLPRARPPRLGCDNWRHIMMSHVQRTCGALGAAPWAPSDSECIAKVGFGPHRASLGLGGPGGNDGGRWGCPLQRHRDETGATRPLAAAANGARASARARAQGPGMTRKLAACPWPESCQGGPSCRLGLGSLRSATGQRALTGNFPGKPGPHPHHCGMPVIIDSAYDASGGAWPATGSDPPGRRARLDMTR